tara:strand:- start:187 stop:378 length:192 start_codon:yes stop_codon:yes gene_type:complete
MTYRNIKNILKKQVDNKVITQWCWIKTNDDEEFIQVFNNVMPEEATEIYTPEQLLNRLNAYTS